METIVAVSSGLPPAAIAIVRVSGDRAFDVVERLVGRLPTPRRAALRTVRGEDGDALDQALVLVFPAGASATGEAMAELHCHGGRAVVAAVVAALLRQPGTRSATAGEFTRRALTNGRIDVAQAQGLADLLEAETELQRRLAMAAVEGRVGEAVEEWLRRATDLAATVEAMIDYADDSDVVTSAPTIEAVGAAIATLRHDIRVAIDAPAIDRAFDGIRVVLAGPPNAGKSTLLNMMVERDAAIVSPIAGTTRDRVEIAVRRNGVIYLVTDTAGLTDSVDPIEQVGVTRATEAIATADLVVWLGDEPAAPGMLWIRSRADVPGRDHLAVGQMLAVRNDRRETIDALWRLIEQETRHLLPSSAMLPLRERQRAICRQAADELPDRDETDLLIVAEGLRRAQRALSTMLGRDGGETLLDALFSRFCIGK